MRQTTRRQHDDGNRIPGSSASVVTSALIGATIEWYDFFLYGVVAGIVFSKLYFPSDDPLISTLLAYTTFAVGFVTRPLGGLIFGHFGDRIGRKSMLVMTLMIMGVATFLIGLVPTYAQIGVAAPILLVLLRVFQGIGLGGEWGGAVLMAYEYAPKEKRGFYASLPQVGLAIGLFMASGVVALLSWLCTEEHHGLGLARRVPDLGPDGGRGHVHPPACEGDARIRGRQGTQCRDRDSLHGHDAALSGNVLKGMGARYIDGVFFNVFGVFSISYLTSTLQISRTDALIGVMVAALVMCFTIPLFGRLSDHMGRSRVYLWGSLITAVSAFPAFWLMAHSGGNVLLIWIAIVVPFGILYAAVYGPEAALFCDLFDAKVRYTGISFVYQFSAFSRPASRPSSRPRCSRRPVAAPGWCACMWCLRERYRPGVPGRSGGMDRVPAPFGPWAMPGQACEWMELGRFQES